MYMNVAERTKLFRPVKILEQMEAIEAGMVKDMRRIIGYMWDAMILQYKRTHNLDTASIPTIYVRRFYKAMLFRLLEASAMASQDVKEEIMRARNAAEFGSQPEDEYVLDLTAYMTSELPKIVNVTDDIKAQAQLLVSAGIRNGLSIPQIMDALAEKAVFEPFPRYRLENIARTEVARAYEYARVLQMGASPEVVGFEISAVLDTRTSDICKSLNGKKIPIGEIGNFTPPFHYQCRTTLLPIFEWENEALEKPEHGTYTPPLEGFGQLPEMLAKDLVKEQAIPADMDWTKAPAGSKVLDLGGGSLSISDVEKLAGGIIPDKPAPTNAEVKDFLVRDITERMKQSGHTLKMFALRKVLESGTTELVTSTYPGGQYLQVTDSLIKSWAATSMDNKPLSIAFQLAVNEEFGLSESATLAHMNQSAIQRAKKYFKGDAFDCLRKYARVMYDSTQEKLKSLGYTHVRLYRGFCPEDEDEVIRSSKHFIKYLTKFQPVSSFSLDENIAKNFGPYRVVAEVPIENVFSTWMTGIGCREEDELVVLGKSAVTFIKYALE